MPFAVEGHVVLQALGLGVLGIRPDAIERAVQVVGKSLDVVAPATYAFPLLPIATPLTDSLPEPPRKVEYTSPVPAGFTFATYASLPPARAV